MIYEFQATQSYNGYDKPWPGGTNINKCPPLSEWEDGYINGTGGVSTADPTQKEKTSPFIDLSLLDANSLTFMYETGSFPSGSSQTAWRGVAWYTTDDESGFISRSANSLATPFTANIPATAAFIKLTFRTYGQTGECLLGGGTVESYSPYTNVCMPEGFNIWNPHNDEFIQVYAGYVNTNTRELYLRPVYEEYAGEELVGPWMSSLDLYAEDTSPTEGAFVIDFGGELTSFEITPFMLQTLLDSLGIRQHFTDGAGLINSLMDQAQGRVRSEEELLHLSRPLKVIAIGDQLPAGITIKPISNDVLPGLPGKFIR